MARTSAIWIAPLFSIGPLFSQTYSWQWAQTGKGTNSENGTCISTDLQGNVFVTGYFYSPSLIIGNDTLINSGNYDVFIAKYDSTGAVQWARKAGGEYDDVALGISNDHTGNVYITGYFFSPQMTTSSATLTSEGVGDMFIIKYDAAGHEEWAQNFGGTKNESGNAITCDKAGNTIVTGYFSSFVLNFGSDTLQKSGGEDAFVAKFDPNGTALWARSTKGQYNDRGNGITCDASGNAFITGSFESSPLVGGQDTLWNAGSTDAFVAKYDSQGNLSWMRASGGDYNDSGYGICVDSSGHVTMAGTFNSDSLVAGPYSHINAGGFDLFLVRYSASGNIDWLRSNGGLFDDTGYAIVSDHSGNVFVTGHSHSPSILFDADTLLNNGVGDVYVAAYSSQGVNLWVEQAGGQADDGSSGLATDPSGNIFVSGYFLSPEIANSQFTLTNSGDEDIFLGKLKKEIKKEENSTSIEFNATQTPVTLYPNPTSGICKLSSEQPMQVEVFDLNGRTIMCPINVQDNHTVIDLTSFSSGLYVLKLTGTNFQTTKKLVRN